MCRLSVTSRDTAACCSTTPALGAPRGTSQDVARGTGLGFTLHKVEPLLAVLFESL